MLQAIHLALEEYIGKSFIPHLSGQGVISLVHIGTVFLWTLETHRTAGWVASLSHGSTSSSSSHTTTSTSPACWYTGTLQATNQTPPPASGWCNQNLPTKAHAMRVLFILTRSSGAHIYFQGFHQMHRYIKRLITWIHLTSTPPSMLTSSSIITHSK